MLNVGHLSNSEAQKNSNKIVNCCFWLTCQIFNASLLRVGLLITLHRMHLFASKLCLQKHVMCRNRRVCQHHLDCLSTFRLLSMCQITSPGWWSSKWQCKAATNANLIRLHASWGVKKVTCSSNLKLCLMDNFGFLVKFIWHKLDCCCPNVVTTCPSYLDIDVECHHHNWFEHWNDCLQGNQILSWKITCCGVSNMGCRWVAPIFHWFW